MEDQQAPDCDTSPSSLGCVSHCPSSELLQSTQTSSVQTRWAKRGEFPSAKFSPIQGISEPGINLSSRQSYAVVILEKFKAGCFGNTWVWSIPAQL